MTAPVPDFRGLAARIREAAASPAPSSLPAQYVEGFCVGMRVAADLIAAVLTGQRPDFTASSTHAPLTDP